MVKKGVVTVLAVIALATFAGLAQAQNTASGPGADVGIEGTVFKVPGFDTVNDVNSYLVRARGLTVAGRDCCIGGDNWRIKAMGLVGFGGSTTTPESAPPGGCTPPTTGYSGTLNLPGWIIGIVSVKAGSIPGGFPASMYMRFDSPGSVSVKQTKGRDDCGL